MQQICSKCNRGMPMNRKTCLYCGGGPIVAKDVEQTLRCPRCRVHMAKVDENEVTIDRCPQCHGTWYDRGELEVMLEQEEKSGLRPVFVESASNRSPSVRHQTSAEGRVYMECPRCDRLMMRKNYMRVSGIMVDVCGYHGLFLDPGEHQAVFDFHVQGGDLEAAKRDEDDAGMKRFRDRIQRRFMDRMSRGTQTFWN